MAAPQSVTSRRLVGSDQKDARLPPSLASSHSGQISFASSPSPAREANSTIPPMFMTAVAQIQARSQALLRAAIASERAKLWPKVTGAPSGLAERPAWWANSEWICTPGVIAPPWAVMRLVADAQLPSLQIPKLQTSLAFGELRFKTSLENCFRGG